MSTATVEASPDRPRPAVPPARRRKRHLREYLLFLAFVGPNFLLIAVFAYWPVIRNLYLSLTKWDMIAPSPTFVGLANYAHMFTDPSFLTVLRITVLFTVAVVAGSLVLGLALALLLNQRLRGRAMVRTFAFAPHVLSGAAVATIWLFVFDPNYGMSRAFFEAVGATAPAWVTTSKYALPALIIVYLWKGVGFTAIVFLAGLQSQPKELFEAADIDGASAWTKFRRIALPLLSPTTFFVLVITIISTFQAFDVIAVMTGGGPGGASTTLSWYIYEEGFKAFDAGHAAAGSVIMFAVLLVLTGLQTRFVERKVHYQ